MASYFKPIAAQSLFLIGPGPGDRFLDTLVGSWMSTKVWGLPGSWSPRNSATPPTHHPWQSVCQ
eukprot:2983614-Amphidinium_carterae.2